MVKLIETQLTSSIDVHDFAKQYNYSYYYLQKMFCLVTGYNLNEYIRCRRLTRAGYDVSNSKEKIIDIAFKYQYGSNEAFSRAFQKFHGVNPSYVRKHQHIKLHHFPIITFPEEKEFQCLSYNIIGPVNMRLVGRTIRINKSPFMEKRETLDRFRDRFLGDLRYDNIYTTPSPLYKIKYNIDNINRTYDVFYGFNCDEFHSEVNGLEYLDVNYPTFIKYDYIGDSMSSIRDMKTIVVEEWDNNCFVFDPKFEIEYVTLNHEDRLDIVYMVSVLAL
jgi:AraC family transcriptional regulator